MSRLDRVIFFSKRDMMKIPMLEQAEKLLEESQDFGAMDLNALLEFHHIHQYFENGAFLNQWTSDQRAGYCQVVKSAFTALRTYFFNITPDDFIGEIHKLEFDNRDNFWELFRYFELYKKINREAFVVILTAYPRHIRYILPLKQLVDYYNTELRAFLLTGEESAELLLSHFEQKNSEPSDYNFPKSLTEADKHAIILSDLARPEANLNYVDLVLNSKHLKLTPKILLKAKQRSESIREEMFAEENSIKIASNAALKMDQEEAVVFEGEGDDLITSYGGAFFDSITNDLKLFSVFGAVFLYTSQEGLITLVNKHTELNIFERIGMQSKNEYNYGMLFAKKDGDSLNQLRLFDLYLTKRGRSIEDLLACFIRDFFTDYFKIQELTFTMPDASLNPSDKIRLLAPEMEYLLKQYRNFVTDGEVSHDLLQMDSTPVFFSDLPSLLKMKYLFSKHDSINTIQYHFFDENSYLADRKDTNDRKTLFQTFENGKVYRTDFEEYQQQFLDQAAEAGDLIIADDGEVQMADPVKVIVAGKLRDNGYISYWHYGTPFRAQMDRLIAEGFLEVSDQLFTTDEISYFNFYLNKKEFSNGKDLRNKYLHGSNVRDERQQAIDYLYFLRTFILVLMKLRDDVTLYRHHLL